MAGNVIEGDKAQVRRVLEARRRALSAEEVRVKGGEAQRCLAALPFFQGARTIALYAAQPFEVPTGELFVAARFIGAKTVFPRVVAGERRLRFFVVESLDVLVERKHLLEPPDGAADVPLEEIDCWVVPGVGFTPRGERLGRGGGHYDVTLALARPDSATVGLTFACCLVDRLPTEPHDVRVGQVVTEAG